MDAITTRLVAVVITVVWSTSTVAAIFVPEYQPPIELHAIMGIVAGSLFGKSALGKARNGNGNGNGA